MSFFPPFQGLLDQNSGVISGRNCVFQAIMTEKVTMQVGLFVLLEQSSLLSFKFLRRQMQYASGTLCAYMVLKTLFSVHVALPHWQPMPHQYFIDFLDKSI